MKESALDKLPLHIISQIPIWITRVFLKIKLCFEQGLDVTRAMSVCTYARIIYIFYFLLSLKISSHEGN